MNNNRVVVDLRKVQYAWLYWENQWRNVCAIKPKTPSVYGVKIPPNEYAHFHTDYPNETCIERARRLDILDKWHPVLKLQLTANHRLTYTGNKALSIWKEWNSRIFGKKTTNENSKRVGRTG